MRHFADPLVAGLLATTTDALVYMAGDGRIVLVNAQAEIALSAIDTDEGILVSAAIKEQPGSGRAEEPAP